MSTANHGAGISNIATGCTTTGGSRQISMWSTRATRILPGYPPSSWPVSRTPATTRLSILTARRYPTASVAPTDCQCLEEISGRASDASQFQDWEQSLEGGLPARWLPKPRANLPAILLVSATTLPRSAGSLKSPRGRTTGISSTEATSCPRHGTLPVSDELGARQHYFCAAPPATAALPRTLERIPELPLHA